MDCAMRLTPSSRHGEERRCRERSGILEWEKGRKGEWEMQIQSVLERRLPLSHSPPLSSRYGTSTARGKYNRTATTISSSSLGYGTNKLFRMSIGVGSAR